MNFLLYWGLVYLSEKVHGVADAGVGERRPEQGAIEGVFDDVFDAVLRRIGPLLVDLAVRDQWLRGQEVLGPIFLSRKIILKIVVDQFGDILIRRLYSSPLDVGGVRALV